VVLIVVDNLASRNSSCALLRITTAARRAAAIVQAVVDGLSLRAAAGSSVVLTRRLLIDRSTGRRRRRTVFHIVASDIIKRRLRRTCSSRASAAGASRIARIGPVVIVGDCRGASRHILRLVFAGKAGKLGTANAALIRVGPARPAVDTKELDIAAIVGRTKGTGLVLTILAGKGSSGRIRRRAVAVIAGDSIGLRFNAGAAVETPGGSAVALRAGAAGQEGSEEEEKAGEVEHAESVSGRISDVGCCSSAGLSFRFCVFGLNFAFISSAVCPSRMSEEQAATTQTKTTKLRRS
jgi:hypothetical protein